MKNIFLSISLLIFTGVFTGCHKDEDPTNYLNVNNRTYSIDKTFLSHYSSSSITPNYIMFGLTFDTYRSLDHDNGAAIAFRLYTAYEKDKDGNAIIELKPGTYTYNEEKQVYAFNDAFVSTHDYASQIISGSIIVKKDNSNGQWDITFDTMDNKGQKVSGHYQGNIK